MPPTSPTAPPAENAGQASPALKPGTALSGPRDKFVGMRAMLEKNAESIKAALPNHMTSERMLRVVLTALQRTPELLDCFPLSVVGAVVQASQLGLEPDGVLGHAYLVPFWNSKTRRKECQLIPGYKGLLDLARRSGQISTISAKAVNAKDLFDFEYGLSQKLTHRPTQEGDPGDIVAFYAVAKLRDGGSQFEVMWKREVDKIRDGSPAGKFGPWVTHYAEMGKKTVLRRLFKMLPVSVEAQHLVAMDEMAEAGIPQDNAAVIRAASRGPVRGTGLDGLADELEARTEDESAEPQEQAPWDGEGAPPPTSPADAPKVTERDLTLAFLEKNPKTRAAQKALGLDFPLASIKDADLERIRVEVSKG